MITLQPVQFTQDQINDEIKERKEYDLKTPANAGKNTKFTFEDFNSSVLNISLNRNNSLIKLHGSMLRGLGDTSIVVLEQSMVAHGFTITEHVNPIQEDVKLAYTSTFNFWVGVIYMLMMVIPCALTGPLTVKLNAGNALIKSSWRTQGNFILSVPLAYIVYKLNPDTLSFKRDTTWAMVKVTAVTSILGFLWGLGLIIG